MPTFTMKEGSASRRSSNPCHCSSGASSVLLFSTAYRCCTSGDTLPESTARCHSAHHIPGLL